MVDYRRLGRDRGIQQACMETARKIAARAKQIDPKGDFVVEPDPEVVDGLPRLGARVTNRAPSAARHEFGDQPGVPHRALGRAGAEFRD